MITAFDQGKDPDRYLSTWLLFDSRGDQYGCRRDFAEAISCATHKARGFLRVELAGMGVRF
jgi:hypothetical protein